MDQQTTSTPQSTTEPPQTTQPPPATTSAAVTGPHSTSFSNPNPTPLPRPTITQQLQQSTTPQTRPSFNTRQWQQPPQPPYQHFSLPSPPLPSSSATTSSSISAPPRMAIGVPAHNPSAPPPGSFSSLNSPSYGQQSQIRQPMQGMGMTGTLGATSSIRPGGLTASQLRPSQSSLRPQTSPSGQSPTAQNFQGHGLLRVPSMGSPGAQSTATSQSSQLQNQPWLSSGSQGKPPLPTPTLRPQTGPQSFQQRSHIPQQHQHNTPTTTTQQQPIGSSQQSTQPSASQDHLGGQQFPSSRIQQPLSHQQQIRPGLGSQRPPLGMTQLTAFPPTKHVTIDTEETSTRIVSKRSIQELVNQIDPAEKLDPDVEDILMDIAEDFVESITTFGCSLAKHRKSTTLEAKDILLHLERNWNMTLPGFSGDEIKTYKKPSVSDIHRERLAAIKKSIATTDMPNRNTGGPSGGNAKVHLAKGPASIIGSPPNPKIQ